MLDHQTVALPLLDPEATGANGRDWRPNVSNFSVVNTCGDHTASSSQSLALPRFLPITPRDDLPSYCPRLLGSARSSQLSVQAGGVREALRPPEEKTTIGHPSGISPT
jgi:hypothetical protein